MNYLKLIAIVLFVNRAMVCFAVDNDLIAHWSFDSLKNGTIRDHTGKHNAAVRKNINSEKIFTKGLLGNAIQIHSPQNMLIVKHDDNLNLVDNFTIKCIFRADKINNYRTLLWKGNRAVTPQRINYCINLHDGKVEFKFKDISGKWCVFMTRKAVVEINKWHQLILTFHKGKIALYLDGKQIYGRACKITGLHPNKYPLYIGAGQGSNGGGYAYPFSGAIDEIIIMKKVHPPSSAEKQKIIKLRKSFQTISKAQFGTKQKAMIAEIASSYKGKYSRNQLYAMPLRELENIARKCRYKKFFNSINNKSTFLAATLNTFERIVSPDDIIYGKIKTSDTINLSAAKGEYEGFQIILLGNPDKDNDGVKIKLNSLISKNGKNKISAEQLEWGYIKTIRSNTPKYAVDFVGEIPDVIMEGQNQNIKIKSSWFSSVYVRIKVKNNVPAGMYTGKVSVSGNDGKRNICINLKVYDFKIPATPSLKTIFSFWERPYKKWYNYKALSDKQKMYIYNFLLKYRIVPNNIYSSKIFPQTKYLKQLKKNGNKFCTIGSYSGRKKLTNEKLKRLMQRYHRRVKKLKELGVFGDTWFYGYDELTMHPKSFDAAKQFMTAFKKEFPNIRTIQTSFPYKNIEPYFNTWCPSFSFFKTHAKQLEETKRKGNELWWYCADSPLKPYPNYFLDYPVFDCRIIMTLSYMYKVKGVLYWCINREWVTNYDIKNNWPGKRWKPYIINCINKKRQYKNGMGNFVYPGKNGQLLPSLRLENLRDGIEDYEYLMILKKLVEKAKQKQINAALTKQAEKLLKVPVNIAVAVDDYSNKPKYLMTYRNKIALMIEKINKILK